MASSHSIVCLDDFESYARKVLPKAFYTFYSGGADDEVTLKENIAAYKRYQIIPRVLRDVSNRNTETTILGHPISFPVCISPTANHGLAHPDAEVGTARGAVSMKIGYTMSCHATKTIDEIADAAGDGLRFFQLHMFNRKDLMLKLVRWAEDRDFKALVLTVDLPLLGKRVSWSRVREEMMPHMRFGTLDVVTPAGEESLQIFDFNPSATWRDVKWLKSQTKLPIVLKGILSAKDVEFALDSGAAAILVSTHGGRQLDTIPASIDVLSSIVKAVNGRCEVYVDGGVRHGTDVLKALALGARAVFIGRPVLYSLCYNGASGVQQMLQILKDEFSSAMALTGCTRVDDIKDTVAVNRPLVSHL